jgi:hypothetical protein
MSITASGREGSPAGFAAEEVGDPLVIIAISLPQHGRGAIGRASRVTWQHCAVDNASEAAPHAQEHVRGSAGAWGAVGLMFLGAVFGAFAIPLYSWPLAIICIVLGAAGIVLGRLSHLMEQFY